MSEINTVNPYADKANLYPDCLINEGPDGLTTIQKEQLLGMLLKYKRIHLEIGSGSGQFLIETARRNPEDLIIGIEIRYKRTVRTVEKAKKAGLSNFLLCRTYAENIMAILPANVLDYIYINFPDPWDKKRWLKHRMIRTNNLPIFAEKLKANSHLLFKTDHAEYFDWAISHINENSNYKLIRQTKDLHSSAWAGENILTEFEQLFQSKKLPVHFLDALVNYAG